MRAYSSDLRPKIMDAVDAGMFKSEAARTFRVGLATIKRYAVLRREQGPSSRSRLPVVLLPSALSSRSILWAQLTAHPAAYLDEHCTLFAHQTGVVVSTSTMSRAIRKLGWTRKKGTMGATERDEARRRTWIRLIRHIDARRLVFIDESGATITLARRYGRAPRDERCYGAAPRNYDENLTLFASLSLEGMRAAMLLDGAADRASFQVYVDKVLVPTLRPRQLVIMDNLSVHKQASIRAAIEAVGCRVLFLPELLAGLQSDRAGVQQDQGIPAACRGADQRGPGSSHW